MPAIALKLGAASAALAANPLEKIFVEGILQVTGSPFSHAEFWIDGPPYLARCFSARELTAGVGFELVDLSDPKLWRILTLAEFAGDQAKRVEYFCRGNQGRDYDKEGIVGILSDRPFHNLADRFCSEMCWDIGQQCLGWNPNVPRWHVAPGWTRGGDRHGLFEILSGTDSVKLFA
jgi:hypothetical protein